MPAAQHFAGLLRQVKFGQTSKIYCEGGYLISDCFRAPALAGYQPAKAKYIEQWAPGNLDDLARQYIDELQHSDDPRSLLAVIGALDHWRFRERNIRRREQAGGELDEQDVYAQSQYLAASDKLFSAYRGLFEAGQLEAGYDLAEMAFVDRRPDVTLENVQHWLRSSFGKTRGMREAFAGLTYEQSGADAAAVRPYFAAAAELGNPFAMAKMARQNLPGGSATLDEATALVDLKAAFATRDNWAQRTRDIKGLTKLGIWIDLAYRELQLTLGPVAFRQATGLINSDDEREQARAVELYKLASRLARFIMRAIWRSGSGVREGGARCAFSAFDDGVGDGRKGSRSRARCPVDQGGNARGWPAKRARVGI